MTCPVIKYRDGFKYQLAEDYTIQTPLRPNTPIVAEYITLSADGVLMIRESYAWDGASGPAWDSASSMRASLVHDALYQLIREGFLPMEARKTADDVLHQICVEDGMNPVRARLWKIAVKYFAGSAAEWKSERTIITAP
jgi:hypothetical protein